MRWVMWLIHSWVTTIRALTERSWEETATYAETAHLANDRYRGGATGFLEVLTTQQQYLNSELQLAEAQSAELRDYVQLYRALGGGWGT
jgi:multidrug efflux system outer membrane protein